MREPDVEARITALKREDGGNRNHPFFDGYRPAHMVTDDYLTTGFHHYYDTDRIELGESALGTITFITPEAYPNCLWEGKVLRIQEGGRLVGFAEITKVFNELLKIKK
jgi:elongation factor Tu